MTAVKLTRPSEDALFLKKKEIIDALKKSEENDEKMDKFLQKNSDSVEAQLHGMNSADMNEKYKNKIEELKGAQMDGNQGKAVITGFHSETSEPEVIQLLK